MKILLGKQGTNWDKLRETFPLHLLNLNSDFTSKKITEEDDLEDIWKEFIIYLKHTKKQLCEYANVNEEEVNQVFRLQYQAPKEKEETIHRHTDPEEVILSYLHYFNKNVNGGEFVIYHKKKKTKIDVNGPRTLLFINSIDMPHNVNSVIGEEGRKVLNVMLVKKN